MYRLKKKKLLLEVPGDYEELASFALLKVQVIQISEIFYYLPNLLLFISNDWAESNIRRNYISNAYFYRFKKSAADPSSFSNK